MVPNPISKMDMLTPSRAPPPPTTSVTFSPFSQTNLTPSLSTPAFHNFLLTSNILILSDSLLSLVSRLYFSYKASIQTNQFFYAFTFFSTLHLLLTFILITSFGSSEASTGIFKATWDSNFVNLKSSQ